MEWFGNHGDEDYGGSYSYVGFNTSEVDHIRVYGNIERKDGDKNI